MGFIRSIPIHPLQQQHGLTSSQINGVSRAVADLDRPLDHPLDPQEMCATSCHAMPNTAESSSLHSSVTPSRANAGHLPRIFPGLRLRKNKAFTVFTPMETSEESPPFVNGDKYSQTAENIFSATSNNLTEEG